MGEIIFVTGTGRCGTKSVADTIKGFHEPEPKPKEEYLKVLCGEEAKLNTEPIKNRIKGKDFYLQSDPKLIPFTKQLKEEFDCKIILLTRDGRDFVRSGWRRKFIRDSLVQKVFPKGLNRFEKLCWLWTRLNEIVLEDNCIDVIYKIEELKEFMGKKLLHTNKTKGYVIEHWTKWGEKWRETAQKYMGDMLKRLGYET